MRGAYELLGLYALLSPAAADEAYEPDDGEYDDGDPEQIDQRTGRVEQEPEDEKDDRSDDEQMDHFGLPPVFSVCVYGSRDRNLVTVVASMLSAHFGPDTLDCGGDVITDAARQRLHSVDHLTDSPATRLHR